MQLKEEAQNLPAIDQEIYDMDKKSDKGPIFVVGPPRCGTTLVGEILDAHSEIFVPGETHFIDEIYSRQKGGWEPHGNGDVMIESLRNVYKKYNEPDDQRRVERIFRDAESIKYLLASSSYKDLFSRFMWLQMDSEGKRRWGNHVPRDIFNVELLIRWYPTAKVIICIRDLKDFLYSYKKKWRVSRREHAVRVKALYHPILTALVWRQSVVRMMQLKNAYGEDQIKVLQYERLVTDPVSEIVGLAEFLQLDYEESMLEVRGSNSSHQTEQGELGIFKSSIGKWREIDNRSELAVAQLVCRREMMASGYELASNNGDMISMLRYILTLPLALIRAMQINKARYGSALKYLMRRI